jgi:hypothetical protein
MLPADGRCLASCPMELATMTAAIMVRTMDSGSAPPANPAPTASEVATAAPGAMNVTDWNSTPASPTEFLARPVRPAGASTLEPAAALTTPLRRRCSGRYPP